MWIYSKQARGAALAAALWPVAFGGTASAEVSMADVSEAARMGTNPESVLEFWRQAGPGLWFAKDANFDRLFRERFLESYEAAILGQLDAWANSPDGALALVILLDQFPRNAFRGTPRMYASDARARKIADAAIRQQHDLRVDQHLVLFFYLPFAHAENLDDQERAVRLVERLGEPHLTFAKHHREIIRRFGRFPHRNPVVGREMLPEEQRYLDSGGFAG